MAGSVSLQKIEFFKKNGYIIVRDLLSRSETEQVQKWAQEVHDWPAMPESGFMPYEVRLCAGLILILDHAQKVDRKLTLGENASSAARKTTPTTMTVSTSFCAVTIF